MKSSREAECVLQAEEGRGCSNMVEGSESRRACSIPGQKVSVGFASIQPDAGN